MELPKDRKAVGSKWVFKLKVGPMDLLKDTRQGLSLKDFLKNLGLTMMRHFVP